ncbi:MAG: YggT family protein [Spirochaetaceae bacterium]|jgi:YggT family protein|nr:YggT family protein [Spirochaetaceae bacterium]
MYNILGIIMNVLGGITGVYTLLIFIRILLTWFSGARYGKPYDLLCAVTDPYLDWFRRFPFLQTRMFDLSPIAALAVLSLVNNIFTTIGRYGRITLGIVLALVISALWSAASFILGFFILILILRLFAYLTNRNIYGTFWRIVDIISQPVLYRINRSIFRNRLVNYMTGILSSLGVLLLLRVGLGIVLGKLFPLLVRFPF